MPTTDVSFDSNGITVAGTLYLPDPPADGRLPAIVVGHPGTGVKEQAAGLYARLLSEQGFATLAFDAAFQGESGGEPRGLEDPGQRVEDFKAAVSFLSTCDEIDQNRIAVLGICASGGYVLSAASDHRIKAFATVSAVDISRQFRLGADGTQDPAVFRTMLDAAAIARTAEASGAGPQTFALFPESAAEAEMVGGPHGRAGFEYYCTARGCHPRSTKSLPWSSVDRIATFDAFTGLELIGARPLLMVVAGRAVTAWMSIEAFQKVVGPKELYWIEEADHVDTYDEPGAVTPAVAKLAEFYRKALPPQSILSS